MREQHTEQDGVENPREEQRADAGADREGMREWTWYDIEDVAYLYGTSNGGAVVVVVAVAFELILERVTTRPDSRRREQRTRREGE